MLFDSFTKGNFEYGNLLVIKLFTKECRTRHVPTGSFPVLLLRLLTFFTKERPGHLHFKRIWVLSQMDICLSIVVGVFGDVSCRLICCGGIFDGIK